MGGVIRWEEPPPTPPRGTKGSPTVADWWLIAAQLRDRPGEWAAIATGASPQQAAYVRSGHTHAFKPAGAFEAVGVRADGVYTLYARYVGGDSDG